MIFSWTGILFIFLVFFPWMGLVMFFKWLSQWTELYPPDTIFGENADALHYGYINATGTLVVWLYILMGSGSCAKT